MANYYVDFENQTDRTWTMVVYQTLPDSIGLESVAWKKTTTPQRGSSGVKWGIDYLVSIADYKQEEGIGVYKSSQKLPAKLGSKWEIVYEEGVQQLKQAGSGLDGYITIINKSKLKANPGVGMFESPAVYKKNVLSDSSAQFKVTPTYYVSIFNDLELGTVISSNVIVDPIEVKFPSGMNKGVLTAKLDGESLKLDLKYNSSVTANYEQVLAML
ncbi:MAG: hypothetical protein V7L26_13310 [Nostoc sp.]|uniref:hypothetical protein n=1 Tax=Nostoc sp. TaxID=1180 RepID=UPI002FF0042B